MLLGVILVSLICFILAGIEWFKPSRAMNKAPLTGTWVSMGLTILLSNFIYKLSLIFGAITFIFAIWYMLEKRKMRKKNVSNPKSS